jgi:hypothetical protein
MARGGWPTQALFWLEWGCSRGVSWPRAVIDEAPFVEKLRYLHRNPVQRGLCERAVEWEWSSFLQYATGCEGRVEIECEWAARKRERAAGRLCPAVELPHSSQNRA